MQRKTYEKLRVISKRDYLSMPVMHWSGSFKYPSSRNLMAQYARAMEKLLTFYRKHFPRHFTVQGVRVPSYYEIIAAWVDQNLCHVDFGRDHFKNMYVKSLNVVANLLVHICLWHEYIFWTSHVYELQSLRCTRKETSWIPEVITR